MTANRSVWLLDLAASMANVHIDLGLGSDSQAQVHALIKHRQGRIELASHVLSQIDTNIGILLHSPCWPLLLAIVPPIPYMQYVAQNLMF